MTGYNLPPGVSDSDLPGNRPEDEAWDEYWDGTDRPKDVYFVMFGNEPGEVELEEFYNVNEEFQAAIDSDFKDWRDTNIGA